ncbi:uncharacterized protein FOMMEDRAFT_17735 [Fomitiporia mediterranea MF3/22]|uniref:uncharacterized protein n=1 Tax=Fomitiporia mediterranea (strain MF3/22) TaxID=694068 RepID=UPI00044086A9|nr:uncharacterized protein FOMMEDRAFT_17735 [Fomitiporia mediterranea MF3/22]EJD05430.1 hypothetical protein FOMMEDRAFT_17735 [Fomitiporia mediterranea MF3/22]
MRYTRFQRRMKDSSDNINLNLILASEDCKEYKITSTRIGLNRKGELVESTTAGSALANVGARVATIPPLLVSYERANYIVPLNVLFRGSTTGASDIEDITASTSNPTSTFMQLET